MSNALLMDYYELSMANSYFEQGRTHEWAVFDYYFRRVPDNGGYAVFAGLTALLAFVEKLRFSEEDIAFLRQKGGLSEDFLAYLNDFHFRGEIYAFPEGSIIFPNEPVVTVRAPLIDCQLLETMLLIHLNHQSLIATKAARICTQAGTRPVFEFGARRAHGADAALLGARAAYIGGIAGSANTQAELTFGVPAVGTMAHAYVQSFDSEYDAFAAYAKCYPTNTVLLVDTYDTLRQGIPNAIKVQRDILAPLGHTLKGIRIDSGDLAYLSTQARKLLDEAGLQQTQIMVSNSLDEYLIKDLTTQHAAIDAFGVGERLITARSEPVFGGVYKIVSLEKNGEIIPKIKLSENAIKTTTPGFKQVYRLYDQKAMAIADLVTLRDEVIDENAPYILFDPLNPWKKKRITHFTAKPMLQCVWREGKRVGTINTLEQARLQAKADLHSLWDEVKRLENPHGYYVDLSQALWQLKQDLIEQHTGQML
ncbi:nicotinate phosphoribosyltransferase [Pasteurellaceae bacterium HPA106]|uniref:nicotinate phosphoribosyltransferase n=1 Tax=Spirabiliibacterium pneumoniae TaxID=221400 RepID=UPI001AAD11AB|nr:nicotinate phosphoribosyltransferase [Spirabiliibacterium pneumoniae]MBE2896408.1 nicotinate phosphoribosyltransferase [Spirabiliibacterium pneumoniae]